ncbi:MAG: GYF domain-containing protein [Verrucomicrobiia bacterium]
MYTLIGSDQKEYGPVSAEEVKRWILEGRVNEQTLAKSEATAEWKTLGEFPEFADVFVQLKQAPPPISEPINLNQWSEAILTRDYDIRVGECISLAFNLYKQNFGLFFGASIIYLLIMVFLNIPTMIPFIGLIFIPIVFLAAPILIGGLYHIVISKVRGKDASIEGLFYCFKHNLLQVILVAVVQSLLTCLAALPGALIAGLFLFGGLVSKSAPIGIFGIVIGGVVSLIPLIYLGVCWMFALPLVVDKGLDFWSALKISLKKVNQHWFSVLWLCIVIGLINLAGSLVCGIGILFAFPLAITTFIYGYETVFGESTAN